MKLSKHRGSRAAVAGAQPSAPPPADHPSTQETPSPAATVASAFTKLRLGPRVRVLRTLLTPVGPMALAVLGGGVFAKFAAQARLPWMPVSVDDAARVTAAQVYELVRYVEQSNPVVLQQVLAMLARNPPTATAIGASVAAIAMQQLAARRGQRYRRVPPA